MKRCPQCDTTYSDDKLFCSADATPLVSAGTASADDKWRRQDDPSTASIVPPPVAKAPPASAPRVATPPPVVPSVSSPPPLRRPARAEGRPSSAAIVAVSVGLVVIAGMWWLWSHPVVDVTNRLATAATVTMPQHAPIRLQAGESRSFRLRSRGQRAMRWSVTPDRSVTPAAASIERTSRLVFGVVPIGASSVALAANAGPDRFFAPLITNQTGDVLCIIVNASPSVPRTSCDVKVPAGANRVFVGYYPLAAGSTVRAVRTDGAGTTYPITASTVRSTSATIPLVFADRHFRAS